MANGFESIRIKRLVDMYRGNPMLFTDDQLDELEQLAQQVEIPFKRIENNFDLKRTTEIAVGGLFEGFTTVPLGPEPRNTYEAIAHSIGHLIGFAPAITSIPLRGLAKGASKLGLKGVQRGLEKGAHGAEVVNKYSVPMFFGDRASNLVNKGISKASLETLDFMKRGAGPRAVLDSSVHLGVASAVSSIWGGPDEILNSMVHGAVAGGAFGGLGNFTRIGKMLKSKDVKNHEQAELLIKAGIGSMITGVPTTLQNQPIEIQLYQYLLGGFFGYTSRPSFQKEGQKFWGESMMSGSVDSIFYPERNAEWNKMSKETQDYIYKQVGDQARITLSKDGKYGDSIENVDKFLYDVAYRKHGREPTEQEINIIAREKASDLIYDGIVINLDDFETSFPEQSFDYRQGERGQILVEIFPDGAVDTKVRKGDYWGVRMDEKVPIDGDKNPIRTPAENLDGRWIHTLKYINVEGDKSKDSGHIIANKPFATKGIDWKNGNVIKNVSDEQWLNIELHLHNKGAYITGGVKDKGVLKIGEYHTDVDQISLEQMFDILARGRLKSVDNVDSLSKEDQHSLLKEFVKERKQRYSKSLEKEFEWFGDSVKNRAAIEEMHMKAWKSNVLWEAQRHGLYVQGGDERGFTDIGRLMETRIGAKDVVDRNKREQLMDAQSMPINFRINGKDTLNIAVLNDWKPELKDHPDLYYKDSDGIDKPYESATDGAIQFRQSVFDNIIKKSGYLDKNKNEYIYDLMEGAGMIKPVIVSRLGTDVLLVKSGGRRASDAMNRYMEANDLDVVIMSSAAKHRGYIRSSNYDYKDGEYISDPLDKRTIPVSDLRIDLGVYENVSKSIKPQLIVRQLFGNANEEQTPELVNYIFDKIYKPLIDGSPEVNKLIDSYLKDPATKIDYKKLNVDEISVENIHKIMERNDDLSKFVGDHIAKVDAERREAEPDLSFTDDEYRDYIYRNKRVINTVGATETVRHGFKDSKKFYDDAYKRYIIDRYLRPKWKNSGKAWMAPYDIEHIQGANKLKSGEFMLDDNHKAFPVKVDKQFEELFDKLIEYSKNVDKKNPIFKDKKGISLGNILYASQRIQNKDMVNELTKRKVYKEAKAALDNALNFMVIRVPADSLSGARVLRFKGFTKQKGNAILTHPRDDAYLGGADKDSDSVFMYHGFDKKILDAYRNNSSEWEKDGRVIDGKSKELDSLFGGGEDSAPFYTKDSIFSPSMRKIVAENVYHGNNGIGWAINRRMAVQTYIDLAKTNEGKLDIYTKSGKKKGYVRLKEDAGYEMRKLAREMLNRSADAGNYPNMISYVKFPQMLFEKAFHPELVSEKWWKDFAKKNKIDIGDVEYKDLQNGETGNIGNVISSFKPNAKSKQENNFGQALDLDEFQFNLNKYATKSYSTLITKLAHQAYKDGVGTLMSTHPYINNYNLVQKLREVLNANTLAKKMIGDIDPSLSTQKNLEEFRLAAEQKDWKKLNALLIKENRKIASFLSLVKHANEIDKEVLKVGASKEKSIKDIKTIIKKADEIKKKYRYIDPKSDSDHKNTYFTDYDREVKVLVNDLRLEIGNRKIKIDPKPYENFLYQYMLSPFVKGQRYGVFSRIPWQSRIIPNGSIREFFKELDRVGEMAKMPVEEQMYKIENISEYMHNPSSFNKLNESFIKIDDRFAQFYGKTLFGEKDPATGETFERKVDKLKQHMSEHPFWSEHPEDAFYDYTVNFEGFGRDFSTITKRDIENLNRYFEYYIPKLKRSWIDQMVNDNFPSTKARDPLRIQRIFYYNRPATLDKKTSVYESRIFGEMLRPVITSDGLVFKKIKKVLSTHAGIHDWLRSMVNQMEIESGALIRSMDEGSFKGLDMLTPNEKIELFNNVVDLMEGKATRESLKDYFNKEFKGVVDKKEITWTGEQMIDKYTKKIQDNLEDFSFSTIHLKYKGKRLSDKDGWKELDKEIATKSLVKVNDYMIWKNGEFDFNNFHKKVIKPIWEGKDFIWAQKYDRKDSIDVPLEAILRAQYEYIISKKAAKEKNRKQSLISDRASNKRGFKNINIRPKESYFPHVWRKNPTKSEKEQIDRYFVERVEEAYNRVLNNQNNYNRIVRELENSMPAMNEHQREKFKKILDDYRQNGNQEVMNKIILDNIKATIKYENDAYSHVSLYGERHMFDTLMDINWDKPTKEIEKTLENVGFFSRHGNLLERQSEMPAYMREYDALKSYKEAIIKSRLKNLGTLMAHVEIDTMVKNKPFGKHTDAHAEFYRMSLRDTLGYRTTFSKWVLEAMHNSDPLKLKKNMYYGTSDHNMINQLDRISKFFGGSLPFRIPRAEEARHEYFSRLIHKLGAWEAQYQLLTLLANTGTATGNAFGGSLNTITKTGLRNFSRAANFKWLKKNLLFDADGTALLYLNNGKSVETKKDLKQWAIEKGVIEQYIRNELELNPKLKLIKNQRGLKQFSNDFIDLLKRNPSPNKATIKELADRYGVWDAVVKAGAFPMQATEIWLRTNSFLSHLLQQRDFFNGMAGEIDINNQAFIDYALKGVEATQFIYHSVGRAPFMRTATGKVLTRFKNFVQNQIGFQREIYKQARVHGFEKGTKPYEDFERLFMINAMLMALGTAFSYSLFDTTTPPPFDWMREMAELLYGDGKERERAFFGTYPRAIAPLQIATPPIARVPQSLAMVLNGDWDRFTDYYVYTLFPFGRVVRSLDKTFDEPYGTTFGRGMQQFFRIPTDKFMAKYDRAQLEEMRKDYIENNLNDMYEDLGNEWDNKEN